MRHKGLCLMGTQACVFSLKPAALLHARGASAFPVANNLGGEEGGKEGGGEVRGGKEGRRGSKEGKGEGE